MTEKPPKRPRDPNQLAKLMIDITTGEVSDAQPTQEAIRLANAKRIGAEARRKSLTPAERSDIASIAARARWKKAD